MAGIGGEILYHACVDIDLPFTLLTSRSDHERIDFRRDRLSPTQSLYVKTHLKRRFKQIEEYIEDGKAVLEG